MFTGIIESQAVLRQKKKTGRGLRLTFEVLRRSRPFILGESVAVDGTCLSVAAFRARKFSADVIPETLRSTTLGGLSIGARVNVERSLRMGDTVGGHWVSGHVDGVGVIRKMEQEGGSRRLCIGAEAAILRCLVPKGSIAIDGISFTVQEIGPRDFTVGVTPHTYRATTLSAKRVGGRVNLEVDLFAKLVERFLSQAKKPGLSFNEKELKQQGF